MRAASPAVATSAAPDRALTLSETLKKQQPLLSRMPPGLTAYTLPSPGGVLTGTRSHPTSHRGPLRARGAALHSACQMLPRCAVRARDGHGANQRDSLPAARPGARPNCAAPLSAIAWTPARHSFAKALVCTVLARRRRVGQCALGVVASKKSRTSSMGPEFCSCAARTQPPPLTSAPEHA